MTLIDEINNNNSDKIDYTESSKKSSMLNMPSKLKMPHLQNDEVGYTMCEVIREAVVHERFTCGIYEAGQVLETCPEEVMFCIMPDSEKCDITMHIHFTLIEAFCWENGIRLIMIDEVKKLENYLSKLNLSSLHEQRELDLSCILIGYPVTKLSESEESLMEFYKVNEDSSSPPIVQLPD